ncbi:hypothetical protein [Anaerotignum faecicola]
MFYAQMNENNICTAISNLAGEVQDIRLIPIGFMDVELIGKKYENGEWVEVPTPEPPLSETEQAILDTAINVDYLVCMKELEI